MQSEGGAERELSVFQKVSLHPRVSVSPDTNRDEWGDRDVVALSASSLFRHLCNRVGGAEVDKRMARWRGKQGIGGPNGSMSGGRDPNHAAEMAPDSDPGRAAVASAYQRFEPRAYLRNNYAPPRGDLSSPDGVGPWKLRCMAQTFATGKRWKLRQERAEVMREKTKGRERETRMHRHTRWGPRSKPISG